MSQETKPEDKQPPIVPGRILSYDEYDEESKKDFDRHLETQRRIFGEGK